MIEPERLNYPLAIDSLVWDIGAYHGEWGNAIHERFGCTVEAFEPVMEYARAIEGGCRLIVHAFGLSDADAQQEITVAGDRTSTYAEATTDPLYHGGQRDTIHLKDVCGFMDLHAIQQVDLAKVNIEGGEYALLRRLIDSGYITRFNYLQVQFHTFMPGFGELYLAIKRDLERTHTLQWRQPWRWESWQRR